MGVLDEVKKWTKSQASSLTDGVKRFKNKSFMEATVAGCAMVAFADGQIKPEEKTKMAGFIERNDALNVFDMSQVITAFERYIKGFEFDITIGKGEALKSIGKIKKNSEEARLLVRVCCAIGTADGDFDEDEKRIVREICQELSLSPSEFGLDDTPSNSGGSLPDWMKKK
jgi:tellurite resistance protein TerB